MKKNIIVDVVLKMVKNFEENGYIQSLIYSFILLLIKIISDTNDYNMENYRRRYGNDINKIQRLKKAQEIYLEENWMNIYEKLNYPGISQYINEFLYQLAINNKFLRGIFVQNDFKKIEYKKLKNSIQELNETRLAIESEEDKIQLQEAIDEVLLNEGNYNTSAKEDFTPRHVAKLISTLCKVKENEEVADLVCGSGSLLIQVIKDVTNNKVQIYCQDCNEKIINLCRLNLLLHQIFDAVVKTGDSVIQNNLERQFDVVVANPPFSTANDIKNKFYEDDLYMYSHLYPYGIPPSSKSDYAFIQNMIQSLKPNGRMATIIGLGALSRLGAEKEIRKNMVKDNVIDAIILLPANLFKQTAIRTCVMLCKKNKTQSDILFIDASKEFKKGKLQNYFSEENISNICKIYKDRKNINGLSYVASLEEVLKNEGNLSVNKYVIETKKDKIDIEKIRVQIFDLEEQLKNVRNTKNFYMDKL